MSFDVRTPIGLLFLAIGLLVAGYGAIARPAGGGLNIDLVWGLAMAAFGAVMLALAWLARHGDLPPPREG
jgi:hypothetical protein